MQPPETIGLHESQRDDMDQSLVAIMVEITRELIVNSLLPNQRKSSLMAVSLKETVEESDTHLGRIFDFSIQALIVLSLVTFSIETLPHLSPSHRKILSAVELLCVVVFTFEYIVRLWVADKKIAFALSFFGIVDLIAILPFYLSMGIDLRSVRMFRFLRLFRILKLVRYNQAIRRFHRALLIAREEIILFAVVALILLYLAAVGIYYFENEAQPEAFASVFHSLWWATATLTTVGYGDVYPVTVGGRCFTFLVLLVGLGIVSVPAGLVASALSKAREIEDGKELFKTDTEDCR